MYKKIAFISILTLSSLSQAQESSEDLYKNHQITLTKQEIKYLLFFPYIKETVIAQVNINGENGESKMASTIPYIKDIIKSNNSKNVTHGIINTGMFFSIEKDQDNKQKLSFNYKELTKIETIYVGNDFIQIPHSQSHSLEFPIVSETMKTKWEANEGISYQLTYNGN